MNGKLNSWESFYKATSGKEKEKRRVIEIAQIVREENKETSLDLLQIE